MSLLHIQLPLHHYDLNHELGLDQKEIQSEPDGLELRQHHDHHDHHDHRNHQHQHLKPEDSILSWHF